MIPRIGSMPVAEVEAQDVLQLLRRIEDRGVIETAKRIKIIIGQVMRYAVATGRARHDPTAALRGILTSRAAQHFAAATTPAEVAGILAACDAYEGTPTVRAALRLAPYVFVRPGELRQARWVDIDLDRGQWCYMASKTRHPHVVPLAVQVVALLRDQYRLTGSGPYVFPSDRSRSRPMSNNALTAAYKRMGLGETVTAHGWRATARTLLAEELGYPAEVIEMQLAHRVRDPLGRAYNRTQWIQQRTKMMQAWADYLDSLRQHPQPNAIEP